MLSSYSIAEAKAQLAQVIRQAEERGPVELTRRGRPVAMVISTQEYQRLGGKPEPAWDVVAQVRKEFDFESLDIDPEEIFTEQKDASPGKDFSW